MSPQVCIYLHEQLVNGDFKSIFDSDHHFLHEEVLSSLLGTQLARIRIVDIDRIRDSPSDQCLRLLQELRAHQLVIGLESSLSGQQADLLHLTHLVDHVQVVNRVKTVVV